MKNFQQVGANIDVFPLLHALQRQPELWNQNKLRSEHPMSPHKEVDDVWLRFQDLKPYLEDKDAAKIVDEHESINYPAWEKLPQARDLVLNLMRRVEGLRLGRVMITKLRPGRKIEPHVDGGSHAQYYSRYHIVLQGLPGSVFNCGDESVQMRTGECWYFDNSVEHSVVNNSADDRIHLIVDINQ